MSGGKKKAPRGRRAEAEGSDAESVVLDAPEPSPEPTPPPLPPSAAAPAPAAPATVAYDPPLDPLGDFFVRESERANLGESYVGEIVDSTTPRGQVLELLGFWCADEQYGIEIGEIQEIIKVPTITDVPRSPKSVLGVISLRGVIVPIVDLREVLQLEKRDIGRESRIVVLRAEGDPVGLLVDRVTHVVRLEAESIEPAPSLGGLSRADLVTGVGRTGEQILIVLEARGLWTVMDQAA